MFKYNLHHNTDEIILYMYTYDNEWLAAILEFGCHIGFWIEFTVFFKCTISTTCMQYLKLVMQKIWFLWKYSIFILLNGGHLGFWRPYWISKFNFSIFWQCIISITCVQHLKLEMQKQDFYANIASLYYLMAAILDFGGHIGLSRWIAWFSYTTHLGQ